MKKVIIIAMLLTVLSVCLFATGVCFADETETYYYVDNTKQLSVYASPVRTSGISMQIPSTYAFKYVGDENSDFAKIEYNGYVGYVLKNDVIAICKQVNDKWGNNSYAYVFDIESFRFTQTETIAYNPNGMTPFSPSPSAYCKIKALYGYYVDSSNQLYFLVDYELDVGTVVEMSKCLVKASDTSLSDFKVEDIPVSAGYKAQTTPDKPISSGEINSGNNVPSLDDEISASRTPKNSLDRYILIAVIAVLCVVIVVLIFVPNRKKG